MAGNAINAIEITDLVKTFGKVRALQGLNLVVKTGEVHGFLGPNGAGKSTTIRVLLGLLRKTSGHAQLLGGDPWKDAVALHRRLAYVPGEVNLWPNLSGGEVIDMLCAMRGNTNKTRRDELVRRFELDPTKKIRTYSKGNRQKVAIISALASDVELYIFDEPTSGLDPLMGAVFQECVKEIRTKGKTVLLSSHILAEVEALCDTLTIIRQGKDIETGSLAEMQHLTRTSITATTASPINLRSQAGVYDLRVQGNKTTFQVDTDKLNTVIAMLAKADVKHLICTPPTLEELFLRQYNDELAADGINEKAFEKER